MPTAKTNTYLDTVGDGAKGFWTCSWWFLQSWGK